MILLTREFAVQRCEQSELTKVRGDSLLIRVFCATKASAAGTVVHRAPIAIAGAEAGSRFEP